MKKYNHVLLALELNPKDDELLIKKAQEICAQYDAKLTMVHAIEHVGNYGMSYGISVGVDIEGELVKEAEKIMHEAGKKANVPEDHQVIAIGPAKQLIIDEAKERNADLIIVGSHGKHGVRLLLGSTANAVLHGAPCDVLAVRAPD